MPLGFFSGASAQGTVDSLTKWRQLFLEEKRIETQAEQAELDRKARERIARQGFDSSEALAILNNEAALERMNLQERYGFVGGVMQQAFQGNLSMDAVPQLQQTLEAWEMTDFLPMLESSIPNLIKPQDAMSYSQQLAAAAADPEQAVGVDLTFADSYFETLADAMPWDTETRSEMREAWNQRVDAVANQRAIASDANQRALDQALRANEANIAQTETETERTVAQTEYINVQSEDLRERLDFFREAAPMELQSLQNRVAREEIQLEHLPDLMNAEVRTALANASDAESRAKIISATTDYLIEQEKARLQGMKKANNISDVQEAQMLSDYRVSLATEGARIALAENDVELAERQIEDMVATTDQRYQDIRESEANITVKNQQAENLALEAQANATSLISDMVARGATEELARLGPELLESAGFSRETANEIISDFQSKTQDNWTHAQKMRGLQVAIAEAERDKLVWEADTQQARWEEQVSQEWAKINQQGRGLDLEERRLEGWLSTLTPAGGRGAPLSTADALEKATAGMTANQFTDLVNELLSMEASLIDPTQAHLREAITAEKGGRYASLRGMVGDYARIQATAMGLTPAMLKENPNLLMELVPPQLRGTQLGRLILEDVGWVPNPNAGPNGSNPGQEINLEQPGGANSVAAFGVQGMGMDPNNSEDMAVLADMTWDELPEDENGKYTITPEGERVHYASRVDYQADIRDAAVGAQIDAQEHDQALQTANTVANVIGMGNRDFTVYENRVAALDRFQNFDQRAESILQDINQFMGQDSYQTFFSDIPPEIANRVQTELGINPTMFPTLDAMGNQIGRLQQQVNEAQDALYLLNRQGQ